MPSYDQSTFLAYRVIQAREMGPPRLPQMVALPGAKVAVAHDRLLAHQDAGHDQHQIVALANERWARDNARTIEDQQRWAAGPYQDAIVSMRKAAMEEAAEKLRKQALFEQILAEREGR